MKIIPIFCEFHGVHLKAEKQDQTGIGKWKPYRYLLCVVGSTSVAELTDNLSNKHCLHVYFIAGMYVCTYVSSSSDSPCEQVCISNVGTQSDRL